MNQMIQDPLQVLEELIHINMSISRERNLHRLLDKILMAARKITAAEAGCILMLDRTKRYLCTEILQGEHFSEGEHAFKKIDLKEGARGKEVDVSAYAALSGQLVSVEDVYQYSGFNFEMLYENDRRQGYRTKSMLVVPLTDCAGISVGVMQLFNRRDSDEGDIEAFPARLEGIVKAFAAQVAVVAENARLLEENRQLIDQLDEANQILVLENQNLRNSIESTIQADEIIGDSPAMQQVFSLMEKVSNSTATVFVAGETGTGKELIAACIHRNSPHRNGMFIAQNCAALPEELLESELFGYQKGAFSGATGNKKGLIEAAHNGTLFLDEIGDMPLNLQTKLLRVLQEQEVRPLGALKSVKVNVRVIAATHQSLPELIKQGRFREDLYYRLNVFPINLPPLRERRQDLPALVNHFVNHFARVYGKQIKGLKPVVMDLLQAHRLPGNIRELRNAIERAVLLVEDAGVVDIKHLPSEITQEGDLAALSSGDGEENKGLKAIMHKLEAQVIAQQLAKHNGNQTRTAEFLGISRRSLVEKLSRYSLRHMDGQTTH